MRLSRSQLLWLFLLAVLFVRLFSLGLYPLMDTTEARYGEIARIMLETGNWLTPQIDYAIPFWGKPPLYAWVSAASAGLLGNAEFSLRLPHLLTALLILMLVWHFTYHITRSKMQALYAATVVTTTLGFLLSAGIIMTDMLLALAMTLAMLGFWRGWRGEKRYVYLMYIGLAIGLLAKGPLIIVLAGFAIFPWLAIHYGLLGLWIEVWNRLHLISGFLLMSLIALPWYLLAEQATPGFIEYFMVGEHFQRFIDSGWKGDLYGSAHAEPRAMIWAYGFLSALPWAPFLMWGVVRHTVMKKPYTERVRGLNSFLLWWLCSPLILFTLARNILPAYVLPGLPALGLLIVLNLDFDRLKKGLSVFVVTPVLMLVILYLLIFKVSQDRSDKQLLVDGVNSSHPVYYFNKRTFSGQYYTNGRAKVIDELPDNQTYYLVSRIRELPPTVEAVCEFRSANKTRKLFFCDLNNLSKLNNFYNFYNFYDFYNLYNLHGPDNP